MTLDYGYYADIIQLLLFIWSVLFGEGRRDKETKNNGLYVSNIWTRSPIVSIHLFRELECGRYTIQMYWPTNVGVCNNWLHFAKSHVDQSIGNRQRILSAASVVRLCSQKRNVHIVKVHANTFE